MDRFFDRLGDLLRSLVGNGGSPSGWYDDRDPDMKAALEELEAYLRPGGTRSTESRTSEGGDSGAGRAHRQEERGDQRRPHPSLEGLRQDYANLEVPFGASLEQVQKSYRSLLRRYHPDRFVRDPEKQQLATEITKRLNESFRNIRRHFGGR